MSHATSSTTTTAKAGRALAGHQGGQVGQGNAQGGGEGGEAGRGRERSAVDPVAEGVGSDPNRPSGLYFGPITLPGDERISQICVSHEQRNTHICEPSRGQFAKVRNLLDCIGLDFGTFLESAILSANISKKEFAERVGTSPSVVTDTVKNRRTPPPDKVEAWADALGLDGLSRDRFRFWAGVAHIPGDLRPIFVDIYEAFESQEARIVALEAALKRKGK